MSTARVLIIDDHVVVRNALRVLLERAGIEVVAASADLEDGLREARRLTPDIIIVDAVLPRTDWRTALVAVAEAAPDARIISLGADAGPHYIDAAAQAGAAGYVLKDEADSRLVPMVYALSGATQTSPRALAASS